MEYPLNQHTPVSLFPDIQRWQTRRGCTYNKQGEIMEKIHQDDADCLQLFGLVSNFFETLMTLGANDQESIP